MNSFQLHSIKDTKSPNNTVLCYEWFCDLLPECTLNIFLKVLMMPSDFAKTVRKKKGRQKCVTAYGINVMFFLLHWKFTCHVGFGSMPTTHYISDWYLLVSSFVRCKQFVNDTVLPLLCSQRCLSDPRPAVEVRAPAWAPTPRPLFLTCMKEMMEHLIKNYIISLSLLKFQDKKIPRTLE